MNFFVRLLYRKAMKKINARIKVLPQKQIKITTDFIKLDAFLKLCGSVQTGGHAKAVIQNGEVFVNNEVCFSRGKKLRIGDKVKFDGTVFEVV